jgi:hypothetical protein
MYASHTSPHTLDVRFLRAVPVRGNLSRVIDRVEQGHFSWEKGLPTQSTTRRLTDPWVYTQFLSRANQWSNGSKAKQPLTVGYDAWLCSHCSIGWLRRETGYGPVDRSAGVLWIVPGALFLRSSDSVQLCRWLVKGYHVWGPSAGSLHRTYMDWRGKSTYRVDQVFPYRVYFDSNRCDYRIWVTACSWQPSSSNLLD